MPELPEVETIARSLRDGGRGSPSLLGREVQAIQLLWERSLQAPPVSVFLPRLIGQQVTNIHRRAKFIVLTLNSDFLLIHLRMSGDLRVEPQQDAAGQFLPLGIHDRAVFFLDGGLRFVFEDARKFGRIWLVPDLNEVLAGLGPEPLDPELTPQAFYKMLISRMRQLKPLLMDQAFLAGLGNIYTDEALHIAGLHPLTVSNQVSELQAEKLLLGIRAVLLAAIEQNGSSIDWVYRGGDFQNHFHVYQRAGQPCSRCGNTIKRIVVGQRGTHFCPICQPPVLIA